MSLGRPKDGNEVKKVYSVRLEPSVHKKLIKAYGSLGAALKKLSEVKNETKN